MPPLRLRGQRRLLTDFVMLVLSLIAAAVLVGLDQLIKYLTVLHIPYGDTISVIPGVVGLSHIHNTGAAWSILEAHTWILTVLSAIASLVILYLILRRKVTHPLGHWSLVLVLAGAVGNLIDRAILGYVIDMFRFLFFSFPVFNFADICITTGGVLLCVYVIFFYGKPQKGSTNGTDGTHPPAA